MGGVSGVPSRCEFPALTTSQCTQQAGAVFPCPSMNPHSIRRRPAEHLIPSQPSLTKHVQSHSKPQRLAWRYACYEVRAKRQYEPVSSGTVLGVVKRLHTSCRVTRGKSRPCLPSGDCPTACQQPPSSNQNSARANDAEIGCCRPVPPRIPWFLVAGTIESSCHTAAWQHVRVWMRQHSPRSSLYSHRMGENSSAYKALGPCAVPRDAVARPC